MARFNVTGMEEVIKDMARMGEHTGKVADDMLNAAASILVDSWKNSIQSHGHIDTGDMFRSVKPTKPVTKDNTRSLTVYPQGKDATGTRNAEKAFIANFGRPGHQRASGFANEAEENAEAPAQEAMLNIWDAFIGK